MDLGPAPTVAIAVALCGTVFVLLAWVWAKVLDGPARPRRRMSRGQLIVLPLVLLAQAVLLPAGRATAADPGALAQLRIGGAVLLIAALVLFDQDLRRRLDDPRDRHRITGWGLGSLAAVLLAAALYGVAVATANGDPASVVVLPAVTLGLMGLAVLAFLLALAFQRRWRRRRAAEERRTQRSEPPSG